MKRQWGGGWRAWGESHEYDPSHMVTTPRQMSLSWWAGGRTVAFESHSLLGSGDIDPYGPVCCWVVPPWHLPLLRPLGGLLAIRISFKDFAEDSSLLGRKKRSPISVTISVLYYVGSHLKGFFFQNQHTMESPGGLHPAPLSPNCSMGMMTSLKNANLDLVLCANMSFNALRESISNVYISSLPFFKKRYMRVFETHTVITTL